MMKSQCYGTVEKQEDRDGGTAMEPTSAHMDDGCRQQAGTAQPEHRRLSLLPWIGQRPMHLRCPRIRQRLSNTDNGFSRAILASSTSFPSRIVVRKSASPCGTPMDSSTPIHLSR